jgi:hypothetical protein
LAQQDGGYISTLMKWNCCTATGRIAKLFVLSALAHFDEAELDQYGDDLVGLENGNIAHDLSDGYVLHPDKFGLERRLSILQKHCNYVLQVAIDFI